RVRGAYERRDDQTADEELVHLVQGCPARGRGALHAWKREDAASSFGPGLVHVSFAYQVDLGPDDQLVWLAAYVDRVRVQRLVSAGKHTLEVQAHVIAGAGPARGRTIPLRHVEALDLPEGAAELRIRVARAEGSDPFRLEARVSPRPVTVGRGGGGGLTSRGQRAGAGKSGDTPPPPPPPTPRTRKAAP